MNNSYREKYLKYKKKYNILKGGAGEALMNENELSDYYNTIFQDRIETFKFSTGIDLSTTKHKQFIPYYIQTNNNTQFTSRSQQEYFIINLVYHGMIAELSRKLRSLKQTVDTIYTPPQTP